jgi:ribosomal protein L7Ae-like RNA K-turn-binding protein
MGNTCNRRRTPASVKQPLISEQSPIKPPPGLEAPVPSPTFRQDAAPFVPKAAAKYASIDDDDVETTPGEKEPWERFLDQKKVSMNARKVNNLQQGRDGTYTSRYQAYLPAAKQRPQTFEAKRDFDILKSWRSSAPREPAYAELGPKKRKQTSLKKQILAQRDKNSEDPFMTKFAEHLQKFKDEKAAMPVEVEPKTVDDIAAPSASDLIPFGLADRHYMSDHEDCKKSNRHTEETHAQVRDYVDMCLTPELESAVISLLFRLRKLKMQEFGLEQKSRRYAVGFREVVRLLANKSVSALLIAPDVEDTEALKGMINQMTTACKRDAVPVVYALSRRQLGAAIQKNVTISVLAITETRGADDLFNAMLTEAELARIARED